MSPFLGVGGCYVKASDASEAEEGSDDGKATGRRVYDGRASARGAPAQPRPRREARAMRCCARGGARGLEHLAADAEERDDEGWIGKEAGWVDRAGEIPRGDLV